jgi:putative heme-binding domain-containing protein
VGQIPVKEIEFATGDPKDPYPFKPTDIVVQRDGTVMVSDYADGQRPKRGRGRIYHIQYVGKDAEPANKAKPRLDSESYYERCEAQAAFERAGKKPDFEKLSVHARMHAVWILAKLDGATADATLARIAMTDPDINVRIQAIRALADLADPILVTHKLDGRRGDLNDLQEVTAINATQSLAALPDRADPRVLREIIIALGRLRWDGAPGWLELYLGKPDQALVHAAMQTMRRADNWPAVLRRLDKSDRSPIRAVALHAVADQYDKKIVDGLIERLGRDDHAGRRSEYATLLTRVYKKPGPWKYWGYRPGPRPVNTVAWEKSDAIDNALNALLADRDLDLRLAVLKSMQREKVPPDLTALGAWLRDDHDPQRAAAVIAVLTENPGLPSRNHLHRAVVDRKHTNANRLLALDAYGKQPGAAVRDTLLAALADLEKDPGPVLAGVLRRLSKVATPPMEAFTKNLGSSDPEVRAAAIEALGELRSAEGRKAVLDLLADKDGRVRRAAALAAGKLEAKDTVESLLKLAADPDVGVRLACFDALTKLREPRAVPLALKALDDKEVGSKALDCVVDLAGPEHSLAAVAHVKRSPTTENLAALTRGLTRWNGSTKREEFDAAVAELHGSSGMLLRWQAGGPFALKNRAATIAGAGSVGPTPAGWRTLFAAGPEGRLVLAPKADPDRPLWFAYSDIDVLMVTPVEFLGSARGSLEVWLNGKSVHRRAQAGKFKMDSDRFAGSLEKGRNRVLVQLGDDNPVEFHLRFRRKSSKAAHEKLTQAALSRSGNPDRGRKLFLDKEKSLCLKCHQLGNQGERIGPELTGVGARFSRIYLIESILEPSRTIAPSFATLTVSLKNGKVYNGVKVGEDERTLTLADNQGQKHVLTKADIDEQNPSAVSTMPEGLEARFSEDEFVDLIAFLASQKQGK